MEVGTIRNVIRHHNVLSYEAFVYVCGLAQTSLPGIRKCLTTKVDVDP